MSPTFERTIGIITVVVIASAWWLYQDYQIVRRTDGKLKFDEPRPANRLAQTIELPNGDGRVYVIQSAADDFGLDIHVCMLHVRNGVGGAISCSPPRSATMVVRE